MLPAASQPVCRGPGARALPAPACVVLPGPSGRCHRRGSSSVCRAEAGQALQDLIVGGAVVGVVASAVVGGLRKEEVCDLCKGTGGAACFGCGGGGAMNQLISRDDLYDSPSGGPPRRDTLGRTPRNPRECRVCKGVGLVLCSKCKGSGYMSKFGGSGPAPGSPAASAGSTGAGEGKEGPN